VHSVAWNCSGTKLASGSVDQTGRIWKFEPHVHVSFMSSSFLFRLSLYAEKNDSFLLLLPFSAYLF